LTAGIAHEIKNPLNFVNNFSGVSTELIDELRKAIGRMTGERSDAKPIPFSAKRWAYSDMPSVSSQSAICCIGVRYPLWTSRRKKSTRARPGNGALHAI
jgi:hypothetical protein